MAAAQSEGLRSITTPRGEARVHLSTVPAPRALLVLGHGAGGGVGAGDLQAAREAALSLGLSVALVEQPYRVAGRRSPPPTPQLDEAWRVVAHGLADATGLELICGGRSSGARVACRTAAACGARAVLCLAFPLLPPARGDRPSVSRLAELEAVEVPVLVVQGRNDRFGIPPQAPGRRVVVLAGDHALRAERRALKDAVSEWLAGVISSTSAVGGTSGAA